MNTVIRASAIRVCAIAVSAVLLGGCATHSMYASGAGDQLIKSGDVNLVPITPDLLASAPAQAESGLPRELVDYRPESYRINPGDTLLVTVWDHPELTTPAGTEQQAVTNGRLVKPDGSFFFPYAGNLNVAGMTVEELRDKLVARLSTYLRSPQVDVNVVGYGSRVTLQGAFVDTTPQQVTTVPLTLSQAIGRARVDTEQADLSGLVLTRDGKDYRIDLDALSRNESSASEIYLKPGDRLFLPYNDRKEVYVVGEVLRPQAITFKTSGMSLSQALGRSGGLNPVTAKGEAVYVIRGMDMAQKQNKPATVYHLDASSPSSFALADRFSLQPGDVVWVGAAGVTRWNRFLSQLLPLSGLISNTASAQYNFGNRGN
ncbi:polysaccharide biosynthesis/export family protein [Vulcaniibacterium tengchongense]|uniref:Polysaccharide export outer membrane protein n=1 Tax=Vulcaniibacterium tengchongense TaxID=1273429 RepID=A0A3N4VR14_9GAMM|nr:polysaccharide biosynthesis/export family protein [Vulcaniibacterium tengchongense]RPE81661.1 polysaccharide export outer membrane protein [Vulcaniibacterium tengchongense]